MPIVQVTWKARNETQRLLAGRQIADTIAEIGAISVDGVHVLFNEVPLDHWVKGGVMLSRRPGRSEPLSRTEYATVSFIKYPPDREEEYIDWRREVLDPILVCQPGFISYLLLRLEDREHTYLLILRWRTRADAEAWRESEEHAKLRPQAKSILGEPPEPFTRGETVHLYK